jgi:hypothetical protein
LDTENPDRAVELTISVNGVEAAQITANLPRPDLAAKKLGSGRNGFSLSFRSRLDSSLPQTVEIKYRNTRELLPRGTRVIAPLDGPRIAKLLMSVKNPVLTPLFVTHIARSGSTLLMDTLNEHPAIVLARHYPYEVKPATYFARAARLLTQTANHERSASATEFMRDDYRLGFNPFNHAAFDDVFTDADLRTDFFDRSSPQTIAAALRQTANDYYRHLAANQNKLAAFYFAEKCEAQGTTRDSLLQLFPNSFEILLIRDPRDVFCSSLAYFPDAERTNFLVNIGNACNTLVGILKENRERTLAINYEALLRDRRAVLSAVGDFLALANDAWRESSAPDAALFEAHATAPSPQESIGRWKHELSATQRQACTEAFSGFLAKFGYEP